MSNIKLIAIQDTTKGPVEINSIDGEEITIQMVDGEVTIQNGVDGLYGPISYSLSDLIGENSDSNIRIELQFDQ